MSIQLDLKDLHHVGRLVSEDTDLRIALCSGQLVDDYRDWSGPFEIRVSDDPRHEGFVLIELRRPDKK